MPRQGYMHAMKYVFGYLQQNFCFAIDFDVEEPDFSAHKVETNDCCPFYREVKEEKPHGMPEPKGKE